MNGDRRYQIFISSTFQDLKEERKAVQEVILNMGDMPAGMELFPASDDSAWELIKGVIDDSDYYVLIIGGRYGSCDEEGLGYTEKEYDYAVSKGIPVLSFLHEEPDKLAREKTEAEPEAWEKLSQFKEKAKRKHCKFWNTTEGLASKVILGLNEARKRFNRIGWIRADQATSKENLEEILKLRNEIDDLKQQLESYHIAIPEESENLMQGEDVVTLDFTYYSNDYNNQPNGGSKFSSLDVTWNRLFACISPSFIGEVPIANAVKVFNESLHYRVIHKLSSGDDFESFLKNSVDHCVVHLESLGLLKRKKDGKSTFWELSPYGENLMRSLLVFKKT